MAFISIAVIFAVGYFCLQVYYLYHWRKTPAISLPPGFISQLPVSVVVVAHNEEETIAQCLRSILDQEYPGDLFEVIVVNDRSSDGTESIIRNQFSTRVRLLSLTDFPQLIQPPAYKKSAITMAVQHAKHDWIIVTDADCTHDREWMKSIVYAKEISDPVFMTAPIGLKGDTMLAKMQQSENLVLMLITAAGIRSGIHFIANGANMSFSKKAFEAVKGYTGNFQYASGDDMFLIEKTSNHFPGRIEFVKTNMAKAITDAKPDWASLIKQRIRWAGKNKGLQSPVISKTWQFVGLYHMLMVMFLLVPIFTNISFAPFLILFICKWCADFLTLRTSSNFFQQPVSILHFIPLLVMYQVYVIRLGWSMLLKSKGDW